MLLVFSVWRLHMGGEVRTGSGVPEAGAVTVEPRRRAG
jgi:hypothetical protein